MEFTTESNEEDNIWVASSDGNIDRVKSTAGLFVALKIS